MRAKGLAAIEGVSGLCAACGVPLDSQYFDESGVAAAPQPGAEVVLARFELPPQYCGVLEYFAQFTDAFGKDSSQIETPGLEWLLRANGRPLYPYLKLDRIVNPWGYGSFQIAIKLDDGAMIEVVVRGMGSTASDEHAIIRRVGARVVGRYWYNAAYGDVLRHSS
jgi:hypothetical protein